MSWVGVLRQAAENAADFRTLAARFGTMFDDRRPTMLKIDVEAVARVFEDEIARSWNMVPGGGKVFPWAELSTRARSVAMSGARAALGELARQAALSGRNMTVDGAWVYERELEAAAKAPDTSALDEARRKLREAEDAQGKAAEAVRAARAKVDELGGDR